MKTTMLPCYGRGFDTVQPSLAFLHGLNCGQHQCGKYVPVHYNKVTYGAPPSAKVKPDETSLMQFGVVITTH